MSNGRGGNGQRARSVTSSVSDIVGKVVRIPASFYGIDVPGMMYRAKVVKKDTSHRNAVILSFFEDDNSVHWAPADDVRKWIEMYGDGNCTGKESDQYAVETLLKFRELTRHVGHDNTVTESVARGRTSAYITANHIGVLKPEDFHEFPMLQELRRVTERACRR